MDGAVLLQAMMVVTCLLAARSIGQQLLPGPARFVERMLRRIARAGVHAVWSGPMRRIGLFGTLLIWLAAVAALSLFGTIVQAAAGSAIGALAGLLCIGAIVGLVAVTWRVARWLAVRQHTPRPLPQRRR